VLVVVVAVCAWATIGAMPTVSVAQAARMAMERMENLFFKCFVMH
jgi:hypothetical protein